jgi:hypothetical protein
VNIATVDVRSKKTNKSRGNYNDKSDIHVRKNALKNTRITLYCFAKEPAIIIFPLQTKTKEKQENGLFLTRYRYMHQTKQQTEFVTEHGEGKQLGDITPSDSDSTARPRDAVCYWYCHKIL